MVFQVGDRGPFVGRMPSVEKAYERPILQEEGPAALLSLSPLEEISEVDQKAIDEILALGGLIGTAQPQVLQESSLVDLATHANEVALVTLPELFPEVRQYEKTHPEPVDGIQLEESSQPSLSLESPKETSSEQEAEGKKRGKYRKLTAAEHMQLADKIKKLTESPVFWNSQGRPLCAEIARELGEDRGYIYYFVTQKMKGELIPPSNDSNDQEINERVFVSETFGGLEKGKYKKLTPTEHAQLEDKIKKLTESPDFWSTVGSPLYSKIATELGEDKRHIRYFIREKMKGQLTPLIGENARSVGKQIQENVQTREEMKKKFLLLANHSNYRDVNGTVLASKVAEGLNRSSSKATAKEKK